MQHTARLLIRLQLRKPGRRRELERPPSRYMWRGRQNCRAKQTHFHGNLAQSNYLGRTEVCRLRTEKKVELDENPAVTAEKLD